MKKAFYSSSNNGNGPSWMLLAYAGFNCFAVAHSSDKKLC